jgi:signal transduction histidine kinase
MSESYSERSESAGTVAAPLRVHLVAERADVLALAQEALHSYMPGASVSSGESVFPGGRVPEADCVVIDVQVGGVAGLEAARTLRMAGYGGGIVLLSQEGGSELAIERPMDPEDRTAERAAARTSGPVAVRTGAIGVSRTVSYEGMAGGLALAVIAASPVSDHPALEAARAELRAAQRLNAIGDLAASVQHAANNPLTALLAEAQLLEMEPLAPDHREAVRRIIELSRRLAVIIRRLDLPRAR